MDLRATARRLFAEALHHTEVQATLRRKIHREGPLLRAGNTTYDLRSFTEIVLVALGKAAVPMAEALLGLLDPALPAVRSLRGLVVGTALPGSPDPRLAYRLGAHPGLDRSSLQAAAAVLDLLKDTNPTTLAVFLISGGASAMVDLPLPPAQPGSLAIGLEDLAGFHRLLVHSGLPIAGINTLRKHVSAVKGGRLAVAASPAVQLTLLVSDVPPDRPDLIASGPTLPDPTTLADCRRLLGSAPLAGLPVPAPIRALLLDPDTPETPKPGDPVFARGDVQTLLSSDDLVLAAQEAAEAEGFVTEVDLTPDDWPFDQAAAHLLARLHELARRHPAQPVCLLSAGELTVPMGAVNPGLGGRNQQFALHCAVALAREAGLAAILSAGSDGIDGNSPAAGAVVDGTTLGRATALGLAVTEALADFDSYPLLDALGDTVITGPTGNNLRDLRILLRLPR